MGRKKSFPLVYPVFIMYFGARNTSVKILHEEYARIQGRHL